MENNSEQVHLPSFSVFANFPSKALDLGRVETVAFSPNGGYMAIGNNIGGARLIRFVSRFFIFTQFNFFIAPLGYTTSTITKGKFTIKELLYHILWLCLM